MNVRTIRALLWALSLIGFGLAAVVVSADVMNVLDVKKKPKIDDTERSTPQDDAKDDYLHDKKVYEKDFASLWSARIGKAKEVVVVPQQRVETRQTDPASELKGMVNVLWALSGEARISFRGPEGQKEAFFKQGELVPLSSGQSAQIKEVFADRKALSKEGTVTFVYKGVEVVLPWKQGGAGGTRPARPAPPEDFGQPPSYEDPGSEYPMDPPPEEYQPEVPDPGSEIPDDGGGGYAEVPDSRIVGPNHWRIAPSEWRDVSENFDTHLSSVAPTVVYDKDGGIAGMKLGQVTEGSFAWNRGFRTGDIVQRVMGEPVSSTEQLRQLMNKYGTSERVVMELDRVGTRLSMVFELAK